MKFSNLDTPVVTINNYLWDTMKRIDPTLSHTKNYGKTKIPFFPISDSASGMKAWENKPYIIYDRMLMARTSPFPYVKCEHIVYALKGKEEDLMEWSLVLQRILDRQDDSAQEINEWNSKQEVPAKVYFHSTSILQNTSTDVRDFSTRPFYISQFIVKADYHFTDSILDYIS